MKQKHWQVSVFDKTSEIIKNDTFYTTDTEAYLVLELIDEDFTPDSATVTVYNIYGKATINASVEIADGIVQYEIPEEAIGHPGGWRTQVIYTKDNEDYTTKIIEFDVGGHLLDNKKPAIVDIENWNSFIAHAEGLVEDWEQLEEIRQANESERISKDSGRDSKIEAVEGVVENVSGKLEKKANKKQEDWTAPTLINGWTDFGGVYETIGYMKDEFGFVHIRGMVKGGSVGEILFTLPEGYRPLKHQYHPCFSLDVLRTLTIRGNGAVFIPAAASNVWVALNGISFKAEA